MALSIGSNLGNLCRLRIRPEMMWLQVAKPNDSSPLVDQRLASLDIDIQPGVWHKMVVELRGNRMIAQLDDRHTIAGEHSRLNVDKTDFGLMVGDSASFDYVRLYRSRPRK